MDVQIENDCTDREWFLGLGMFFLRTEYPRVQSKQCVWVNMTDEYTMMNLYGGVR